MSKRSLEPEHEEGRKQAKHGDEMAIDSELMAHHKGNAKGDAVEESESKSGEKQVKAEESEETALNAVANAAASIGDHSKEQQEQQDQAQQHQQQQQAYHQNLLKQKNDQHQAQPAPHQSPEANHASAHGSPLEHHPGSPGSDYSQAGASKPQHGSEEWHKQRKDNHKEVERRRREAINVGIKELAELIPTRDTNKTQILQRAVEYIKRLKENENNNIEKWTLEKLLTEQAVSELSASNEKLKQELERAYREIERLKEQLK